MDHYRVFIAAEVIQTLRSLNAREKRLITRLLDELPGNPSKAGDYVERDSIGRPIQVIIVERYALFFAPDHPVKEVKVIDLRLAGS
jgi:mRNA-degrading endonuclease RelE of RelBE toxin-antitoxin system